MNLADAPRRQAIANGVPTLLRRYLCPAGIIGSTPVARPPPPEPPDVTTVLVGLGLRRFRGAAHALAATARRNGRRFYNDSAQPRGSTIRALRSIASPVWLLAGGADKGCNFQPMAATIVRRARGAAFFGAVGRKLHDLAVSLDGDFPCCAVKSLEEALAWCAERCGPGESVLLSPGCAATDQFQNYRRRGERFAQLVGRGRG